MLYSVIQRECCTCVIFSAEPFVESANIWFSETAPGRYNLTLVCTAFGSHVTNVNWVSEDGIYLPGNDSTKRGRYKFDQKQAKVKMSQIPYERKDMNCDVISSLVLPYTCEISGTVFGVQRNATSLSVNNTCKLLILFKLH